MGRAGGEYQEGGRTLRAELPRKGSREPPRVNLAVGNRNHVKSSQASQTFPARVSALARWQLERPRAKQQSNQLIARICARGGAHGVHFWREGQPCSNWHPVESHPTSRRAERGAPERRRRRDSNLPWRHASADFSTRAEGSGLLSGRCPPGPEHGTDWTLSGGSRVSLGVGPGRTVPWRWQGRGSAARAPDSEGRLGVADEG